MISSSSRPTRPNFFPWSEALRLGYPCNLQDLDATRNCTVGIMNPDSAGVAALTADPLVFAIRDYPLVEPAGLRTHQARTNVFLHNEDLTNVVWTKGNANINANAIAAPDGVVDADKLEEDATAGVAHSLRQNVTLANSTQYCVSYFVKNAGRYGGRVVVSLPSGNPRYDFNLTTGTTANDTNCVSGIESWGNGWYRLFCVFTTGIADAGVRAHFLYLSSDDGTTIVYNGDGASGLYVWGAQHEAGHAPSPYIETGAGAVSSVAPVYDYRQPKLIYHAGRDALEAEVVGSMPYLPPDNATYPIYEIWEDANNNISLRWNPRAVGNRWSLLTETGGVQTGETQNSALAPVAGTKYLLRLVGAIGGGTWTLTVYNCNADGSPLALVETITFTNAVTFPNCLCNRLYLGCRSAGTGQIDFHIWRFGT